MKKINNFNYVPKHLAKSERQIKLEELRDKLNSIRIKNKLCFLLSFIALSSTLGFIMESQNFYAESNPDEEVIESSVESTVRQAISESSKLSERELFEEFLADRTFKDMILNQSFEYQFFPIQGYAFDFPKEPELPLPTESEDSEPLPTEEEVVEEVYVTNEDKINYICEKFGLTSDQFNTVKGIVIAEAEALSYKDAYAVINAIYNRIISSPFIYDVNRHQGEGTGTNLYYQVIQKNQFSVYGSGAYKEYLNSTAEEQPGVQAVIDFLYGVPMENENGEIIRVPRRLHDYMNFVGHWVTPKYQYHSFTSHGNRYGVSMKPEDYVSNEFIMVTEEEIDLRALEVEGKTEAYLEELEKGTLLEDNENVQKLVLNN